MTITNATFEAFLRCPTKCFLQTQGAPTSGNVYAEWVRGEAEAYRLEGAKHLSTRLSPVASINGWMVPSDFISANWRCALDPRVRSQNLESRIDVIERLPSHTAALLPQFVPVRFVRANKPNNVDKLMLAFDALVLSETIGQPVDFGRIIHGNDRTSVRIKIGVLAQQARKTIEKSVICFRKDLPQNSC